VSRINWDEMLAGLERQRISAAEELADIDAVIDTVRQRAAPKVRVAELLKPKPAAHKNGAKPSRASSAETDQAKLQAKKRYERGDSTNDIAKQSGRSVQTIYGWASEGKWKRPNTGAAVVPAAAAPTPKGEQLSGSVRCTNPECGQWTDFDPCRSCGKKLNRKGW